MAHLTSDNKMVSYICGRCGHEVIYRKTQPMPSHCTECGTKGTGDYVPSNAWKHGSKKESDVPGSFKFNLNQF